ncbi:MAG: class I SAM-dependent methyltransferase [Acidimicrobiia bacterium]|nr:class I SAM-dependent methyltransferase [Acidimicrobiia bacterium]
MWYRLLQTKALQWMQPMPPASSCSLSVCCNRCVTCIWDVLTAKRRFLTASWQSGHSSCQNERQLSLEGKSRMNFENKEPTGSLYSRFPFPNHPSHIVGARSYAEKFLKTVVPQNMLFLGCGTGEEVIGVASVLDQAKTITCVEPNRSSVELAESNLKPLNADIYHLDISSFAALDRKYSYDFIWCSGVLHHTLDPQGNLRNIRKLISDTGLLVLGMYHNARWKLNEGTLATADISEAQIQDTMNNPLEITMGWREYLQFVSDGGFEILSVNHKYRLPRPKNSLMCLAYDAIWNLRRIQMMSVSCRPKPQLHFA